MEEENEKRIDPTSMPIFKKGEEIQEVIRRISDLIPDDDEMLQHTKGYMLHDASMLTVKIAGAEAGELYDIKMEAAAMVRKAARDLLLHNHSLEMYGFEYTEYYDIVRKLIEEYRLLFIAWIDSFDPWDYIIDRWGLFNPPGVGPFDHDPDDDIPFHGFDED
jgi:hypothetical protein